MTDGSISPKFFNQVAQFAHTSTMAFLTLAMGTLFGWTGIKWAVPLCILYAAIHEFWWDPREENAATRGSDLEDFAFLVGGSLLGVLVFWIGR